MLRLSSNEEHKPSSDHQPRTQRLQRPSLAEDVIDVPDEGDEPAE